MPTLGDYLYSVRNFFSLQPTTKAQRSLNNPVTSDVPSSGRYSNYNTWEDERRARLALYTGWSFSAIRRIGMACLASNLRVKRRVGEDSEDIKNHPIELLVQSPNPDTSHEMLWLDTTDGLNLKAAYWFMYPNSRGDIAEIWPMPFNRVRPLPDMSPNPTRLFAGFIYTFRTGEEITIPVQNVVYLRFPDPLDPYGSLPPLKAASRPIISDTAQADWGIAQYDENKGLPASIVSVPAELDNDQFNLVKRDLKDNVGRRMVTRAGTISVEFMQQTQEVMQYYTGRELNEKEIDKVFGIPANIETQDGWRTFINQTVWPMLQVIGGQIDTQLIKPYFGPDIFCEFDDIRVQDRSLEVQESIQYDPQRSFNEARKKRGEPPLPKIIIPESIEGFAGQSLYDDIPSRLVDTILPLVIKGKPEPVPPQGFDGIPSMAGSAGADHQQVTEQAQANPDAQQIDTQPIDPQAMVKAAWQNLSIKRLKAKHNAAYVYLSDTIPADQSFELAAVLGLCRHEAEVKAVFSHLDEYTNLKATLGTPVEEIPQERLNAENEVIDPLQAWLEAETIRIIQNSRNGEPPDQAFWDNEQKLLLAFILPFVGKWTEAGIAETVTRINTTGLGVDALVNAEAANWANDHALELARGMTDTTRELAKAKIKQWLAGGSRDMAALEQSLSEVIAPRWRVSLVAQTEVSRAFAQARQRVGEALEIVKGFIFVSLEGACPICGPGGLDGKTRPVNGTYPGGYLIPVHPKCRCGEDLLV